jgi:hypothetical protein
LQTVASARDAGELGMLQEAVQNGRGGGVRVQKRFWVLDS